MEQGSPVLLLSCLRLWCRFVQRGLSGAWPSVEAAGLPRSPSVLLFAWRSGSWRCGFGGVLLARAHASRCVRALPRRTGNFRGVGRVPFEEQAFCLKARGAASQWADIHWGERQYGVQLPSNRVLLPIKKWATNPRREQPPTGQKQWAINFSWRWWCLKQTERVRCGTTSPLANRVLLPERSGRVTWVGRECGW